MGWEYKTSLSSSSASRIRPTHDSAAKLALHAKSFRFLVGDISEHNDSTFD